jgi:hypothetical protein
VNVERFSRYQILLFIGDAVIFAIVTIFGFASHDTLGTAGFRMLTTFVPVVIAWLLIAPHLNVYNIGIVTQWRDLWRSPWAMVLAAPMAAFLRGVWLGTPINPVFVVVIGGVNTIAILMWRAIFLFVISKWVGIHG